MTLPNFLVIGAQKAGTTSLYYYLRQHPDVYMSPVKEAHFFDYAEQQGFRGPGPSAPPRRITGIEDYRALFAGAKGEKALGEVSPLYLYVPETPQRIRRLVPEARLIAILRNPADRAYSAFLHTTRRGFEPLDDFARALGEEDRRVRDNWHPRYHYRRRGLYCEQLGRYFDVFDRDQIGVFLYEELRADPLGVLRSIFRFLEVDESFVPDVSAEHNVAGVPKNEAVRALLGRLHGRSPLFKRLLPLGLRQRIKGRVYAEPPPLAPEVRRDLLKGYRQDILKLQDLIGRDLSAWLE